MASPAGDQPDPRLAAALLLLLAWLAVTNVVRSVGGWLPGQVLPLAVLAIGALAFGPPEWRWPTVWGAAGSLLLGAAGGAWRLSPAPWWMAAGVPERWQLLWLLGWVGVLAPVAEELFFRGLLQDGVRARFGRIAAVLVAAGAFGAVHLGHAFPIEILLLGLAFSLLREATGTLAAPVLAHVGWNVGSLAIGIVRPQGFAAVGLGITAMVAVGLLIAGNARRGGDAGAGAGLSGATGAAEPAGLG